MVILIDMAEQDGKEPEDQWQDSYMAAIQAFGATLSDLNQRNPWPDQPLLPQAMAYLMTELWDHGFSQTEIRQAFISAVDAMPRYAGGEEVRS